MARVWIHDRNRDASYRKQVAAAKKAKRQPPMRWQVRWPNPNDPKKVCTETRRTVPEAEDLRDAIAESLRTGTYRDPKLGREKVKKVAEAWFEAKTPKWTPKTRRLYREVLEGYIYPVWGATAVAAVDYEAVATWLSGLHNKPGLTGSKKRTVGASRIQTIYHVMRSVMAWAVRTGRIAVNPMSGLDTLPEKPAPKRLYLDHVQVSALADAVGGLETAHQPPRPVPCRELYRVMVLVMAYCGLRIGEVIALRKVSVRLDDGEVDVVEAVSEGDDGKPAVGLPKGGKLRVVGLPDFLVPELQLIMSGLDDGDLVFTSARGDMINAYNFRERVFRPAVKKAELPEGTTPHTLRHSFASLSVAEGCDVKTLQAAMGHATATMTLDVYADLFPARVGEVARALGKARAVALAA